MEAEQRALELDAVRVAAVERRGAPARRREDGVAAHHRRPALGEAGDVQGEEGALGLHAGALHVVAADVGLHPQLLDPQERREEVGVGRGQAGAQIGEEGREGRLGGPAEVPRDVVGRQGHLEAAVGARRALAVQVGGPDPAGPATAALLLVRAGRGEDVLVGAVAAPRGDEAADGEGGGGRGVEVEEEGGAQHAHVGGPDAERELEAVAWVDVGGESRALGCEGALGVAGESEAGQGHSVGGAVGDLEWLLEGSSGGDHSSGPVFVLVHRNGMRGDFDPFGA